MRKTAATRDAHSKQLTVRDRIRAPRQIRSAQTMKRVLDAFESLLENRPYEAITIADITAKSKTGAGSVYARFHDKRSILVALHERTSGRALAFWEDLYDPSKWVESTLDEALASTIRGSLKWYFEHRNVIKAALLLNDRHIYERVYSSFKPGTQQLAFLLQDKVPGLNRIEANMAAARIFRLTTAVFQQMTIFYDSRAPENEPSDDDVIAWLVQASLALVGTDTSAARAPKKKMVRKRRG